MLNMIFKYKISYYYGASLKTDEGYVSSNSFIDAMEIVAESYELEFSEEAVVNFNVEAVGSNFVCHSSISE